MHIVHSAIRLINSQNSSVCNVQTQAGSEIAVRYLAYKKTCDKYSREIADIQQYLPGWMPQFK